MELTIGSLFPFEEDLRAILKRLGIQQAAGWSTSREGLTTISLFNLASVCLFLDHVSAIEGFKDLAETIERTRFRHLPWWMSSIWVPVTFQPPAGLVEKIDNGPVFLGSCHNLLADLAEIQRLSNCDLGVTPDGYEMKRRDCLRWDFKLSDDRSLIQWIWKGLYDGAELAIRNSTPMVGMD